MLSASEKALLDVVLQTADGDENRIRDGVIKALRGVDDKARRTYLWNQLSTTAKSKIRRARKIVQLRLAGKIGRAHV